MTSTASVDDLGIRMQIGRGAGDKYLSFRLAGEAHALPILKVREIIGMMRITPLPQAPAHVRGVINLRGQAIAVIDLRTRLGLAAGADGKRTSIVVVQAPGSERLVGLVVDQVDEVLNVPAEAIEPPPPIGGAGGHLRGVGKVEQRVLLVLDIDGLLAAEQDCI